MGWTETSSNLPKKQIQIKSGYHIVPTLDSGIGIAPGVNLAHGTFGKTIKRSP